MFDKKAYHEQWQKNNPKHLKQYRKDNKVGFKKAKLKHRYGLSLEDWLAMWESQDGRCAICRKSFIQPSDAHVDHNHETNEVRGLLCGRCNRGIGMFHDDMEELMNAVRYLNKYIPD